MEGSAPLRNELFQSLGLDECTFDGATWLVAVRVRSSPFHGARTPRRTAVPAADLAPSVWGTPAQEPVQGAVSMADTGAQPLGLGAAAPPSLAARLALLELRTGLKGTPRATPSGSRPACSVFQGISMEDADTEVVDAVPEVQDTVQVIPGSRLLWRINTRPPNSAQVSAPPYLPLQPHVYTCYLSPLSQSRQRTSVPWSDGALSVSLRGLPVPQRHHQPNLSLPSQ